MNTIKSRHRRERRERVNLMMSGLSVTNSKNGSEKAENAKRMRIAIYATLTSQSNTEESHQLNNI